jgi:hypothetical protein
MKTKMNIRRELIIIKARGWTPFLNGEASPITKEENLV